MDRFKFLAFTKEFPDVVQAIHHESWRAAVDHGSSRVRPDEGIVWYDEGKPYIGSEEGEPAWDVAHVVWIPKTGIQVKRMDEEVLRTKARTYVPSTRAWDRKMSPRNPSWHWVGPQDLHYCVRVGETPIEAADHLGSDNLSLLVKIIADLRCKPGDSLTMEMPDRVTIYKPEKAVSLGQRIQEAKELAMVEIQAEADF